MSQDKSSMFLDAVYLFAKMFSKAPSSYDTRKGEENYGLGEELPDGTWVNQNKLAEQVVLAAFAYLYQGTSHVSN